MPFGTRIKRGGLENALPSIDIDEGVRIESGGKKIFVNRKFSGTFVVQLGDEFYYLDSAAQVVILVGKTFGRRYTAYVY